MKIGILEDNPVMRNTLVDHFSLTNRKVIFAEDSFSELRKKGIKESPDFILLDIHLKAENGMDMIGAIKDLFPNVNIIVISGDTEEEQYIIDAFKQGVNSFIYKPFTMAELDKAIEQIQTTGSFIEPQTLTSLLNLIAGKKDGPKLPQSKHKFRLTDKEEIVMNLIIEGLSYKEIAAKLNISYHTVNHHLKNIYLKLDVNSKGELISKFLKKDSKAN